MDVSLDLSRWRALPRGVGYRRWTIVSTGLRQVFRLRVFRLLCAVSWLAGALIAVLGFVFAQTVTSGGWLETLAANIGARMQAVASATGAFVLLYPDVCIGGYFTVVFWLHSYVALWLSLVAMTLVIPRLITRDRASNALIMYLSRPLTSADYLLGKLGVIVGVLAAVWTGPLVFGWLLSVVFAPNTDFIAYSFEPLVRALAFHAVGVMTLAAIALGVSALSRTSRNTVLLWIGLWVILGFLTIDPRSPQWLQRTSFTNNLTQVRSGILRPDAALITAGEQLPLTDREFAANLTRLGTRVQTADFRYALLALGAFVTLSSVVFLRRLRPE